MEVAMYPIIQKYEQQKLKKDLPDIRPGDTVQVALRIVERDRERIQIFEGVVIARKGRGLSETVTVRKMSFGVGVEKIIPLHAPVVESIKVIRRGKVRRAKLYYLRDRIGKAARVKSKRQM